MNDCWNCFSLIQNIYAIRRILLSFHSLVSLLLCYYSTILFHYKIENSLSMIYTCYHMGTLLLEVFCYISGLDKAYVSKCFIQKRYTALCVYTWKWIHFGVRWLSIVGERSINVMNCISMTLKVNWFLLKTWMFLWSLPFIFQSQGKVI